MSGFFGQSGPAGVSLGLNFSGTTASTDVTSGTTANTLGSWVSLGTSPPWPTNKLTLVLRTESTSNYGQALFNIGIGASGSQVVVIPNITMSMVGQYHTTLGGYTFPLFLLPNTEVWIQSQDSVGGSIFGANVEVEFDDGWPSKGMGIVTVGADTSTSSGTIITSGASTNTLYTVSLFTTPAQPFRGGLFVASTTSSSGDYFSMYWRIVTSTGSIPLTPYKRFIYNGGLDSTGLMGSAHLSGKRIPPSTALDFQYQFVTNGSAFPINVALYGFA